MVPLLPLRRACAVGSICVTGLVLYRVQLTVDSPVELADMTVYRLYRYDLNYLSIFPSLLFSGYIIIGLVPVSTYTIYFMCM